MENKTYLEIRFVEVAAWIDRAAAKLSIPLVAIGTIVIN